MQSNYDALLVEFIKSGAVYTACKKYNTKIGV
jgi:hypothetical protein